MKKKKLLDPPIYKILTKKIATTEGPLPPPQGDLEKIVCP
jgi:hypothetical protein